MRQPPAPRIFRAFQTATGDGCSSTETGAPGRKSTCPRAARYGCFRRRRMEAGTSHARFSKCFSLTTLIFTVAGSLAAKQEHGSPERSSVLPRGSVSLARFRTTAVLTTAARLVGHRATRQRTASLPYPNSKRNPIALGGREAESEQKSDHVRVNYWDRAGRAQFRTGGFRSVDL